MLTKCASRKVFKKLGFEVSDDVIHNITTCKHHAIEQFLLMLRDKMATYGLIPVQQVSSAVSSSNGEHSHHSQFSHCCYHLQFENSGMLVVCVCIILGPSQGRSQKGATSFPDERSMSKSGLTCVYYV